MALKTIKDETLLAIAEAIRDKNGETTTYKPTEMAEAIAAIETGGGGNAPTPEELAFSGTVSYLFAYGNWNWFLEKYKNGISFQNVSNAQNMFANNGTIQDLSYLTIPMNNNTNVSNMFGTCGQLTKLPKVTGAIDRYTSMMFSNCIRLSSDEINNCLAGLTIHAAGTNLQFQSTFSSCYSARDITPALEWVHTQFNSSDTLNLSYTNYGQLFYNCYALDSIENIPVFYRGSSTTAKTSNAFSSAFNYCERAKDITFATDNGTPYVVRWKAQTIDLTTNVGYLTQESHVLNYNSGITSDKKVNTSATYQALKDDPDWYAILLTYSRYNHDSAVNTINSLPDTSAYLASAGGTNTIKFKGQSGELTDGGAINTLTAEEIAVATAKGWTVTLA